MSFTHSWSVKVPKCSLLAIQNFSFHFISFLINSKNIIIIIIKSLFILESVKAMLVKLSRNTYTHSHHSHTHTLTKENNNAKKCIQKEYKYTAIKEKEI